MAETLREARIDTVEDEQQGAEAYISYRKCWNGDVVNLARYMDWSMSEIDTAMPPG